MIEFTYSLDDGGRRFVIGLGKLANMPRKNLVQRLADRQVLNIVEGVERGESLSGRRFEPSERAIRDRGQTLIDHGHMIGAVHPSSVTASRAVIGLGTTRENIKGRAHQFGLRVPPRPWFGLRKGDAARLEKEAVAWGNDHLHRSMK